MALCVMAALGASNAQTNLLFNFDELNPYYYNGNIVARQLFNTAVDPAAVHGRAMGAFDLADDASRGKVGYFNDGSTSYVAMAGFTPPTEASERTISVWVKPVLLEGVTERSIQCIGGYGSASSAGWLFSLCIDENGRLRCEAGGDQYAVGTGVVSLDTWTHVAVTFEGTTIGDVKFYINGNEDAVSDKTAEGDQATLATLQSGANVGYYSSGEPRIFTGYMDDFRILATALTGEEIIANEGISTAVERNSIDPEVSISTERNRVKVISQAQQLQLSFYDISGRMVKQVEMGQGERTIVLEKGGMYIVILDNNGVRSTKKIVLMR